MNPIDNYIANQPQEIQVLLEKVRSVIREMAPDAAEDIKYGIPTFILHGNLVHFAAHKHHIGFYPTPSGLTEFANELAPYQSGKGTAQFPLDQPLPLDLIRKIVAFRVAQNLAKKASKKKKTDNAPE